MVMLVGTTFIINEKAVAQSNNITFGSIVESLFMEFDKGKYKEFLPSNSSNSRPLWRCYKI